MVAVAVAVVVVVGVVLEIRSFYMAAELLLPIPGPRFVTVKKGNDMGKRIEMPKGKAVFVRTVTHHYTGRVVECTEEEVELESAAWIPDDGRFHECLKTGKFSEVEPYPDDMHPVLNRSSFVDWVLWPHELPREAQ